MDCFNGGIPFCSIRRSRAAIGLGRSFVDLATVAAGRYTGGLAKVSVVSSAVWLYIWIVNCKHCINRIAAIPNMKKWLSWPFRWGVETAASAGGQITPPIMGAAAFVLASSSIPYSTVVIAAAVPAAVHYIGVMSIVHLSQSLVRALEQIPQFIEVIKRGWMTSILVPNLCPFLEHSPHMAAFWGIPRCSCWLPKSAHRMVLAI